MINAHQSKQIKPLFKQKKTDKTKKKIKKERMKERKKILLDIQFVYPDDETVSDDANHFL